MSAKLGRVPQPLKWHGGKYYLAPKIVGLMPILLHYVEPFAGGLSVLLAKGPDGVSEVVNDVHGDLTNFWQVLQEPKSFTAFVRTVEAVPFSEAEWRQAAVPGDTDPVGRPGPGAAAGRTAPPGREPPAVWRTDVR